MAGRGVQHLPLARIPAQWDPQWFAQFVRDVLAKADARNAEGSGVSITGNSDEVATISLSADVAALLNQRFVVTAASPFLAHERVLAGESGVVEVTDGGDNANVTVSLATNGVPLAKLALQADFGVLGVRYPGGGPAGQVINISPTADGQALTSDGISLDWRTAPVWGGDHQWNDGFGILLGTGADATIEHDGTALHFDNITGDSLFTSVADFHIAALTFTVETNGTERLVIDDDGAWNLAGDAGTSGDVLTSAGTGAPPIWTTPAGGGGGFTFIGESVASSPAASLTVGSIPNTYRALMVTLVGRTSAGSIQFHEAFLQFNGDTGNNYDYQQHYGISTTGGQDAVASTNKLRFGHVTGSLATAHRPGVATAFVLDYAQTTFDKVVTSLGGMFGSTSAGDFLANHYSGVWRPATPVAITSITAFPDSGNFEVGSRLVVYGVP